MSESHRGPGKVLGVKEVEGGLALNLGGDVARHSGDPVVSVDDAAIREVAGQVLVLDSLDQAQLCDGPGEKITSSSLVQWYWRVILQICKPTLCQCQYMTLSLLSHKWQTLTCPARAASPRQTRPCWTAWSCGPRGACAGTGAGPRDSGASPSPGCRMSACNIVI